MTFKQATALELPFADGEFDFVCCSGVLHHTRGVERGLREIHRVLKPGGSLYLLLYGAGGVFWPLNALLRPFCRHGRAGRLWIVAVEHAGYAANKRRSVLDDLFVPILETYTRERVDQLLADAGFPQSRRWTSARLDHETDANTMLVELESRLPMWEAGYQTSADPGKAVIQLHCANLCRTVIASVRDLIEQHKAGIHHRGAVAGRRGRPWPSPADRNSYVMPRTILVSESSNFSPAAAQRLEQAGRVIWADLDRPHLLTAVSDATLLWVRLRHQIDREVIDAAPRLQAIATPTTGLNHIDLACAERRGIRDHFSSRRDGVSWKRYLQPASTRSR